MVNGKGFRLSAKDRQGNQVSVTEGQVTSGIPGARLTRPKGGSLYDDDQGWFLVLPPGSYTISIDGKANKSPEPMRTAIFRPGLIYILDGVDLDPGQHDELDVDEEGKFSYTPGDDETFNIGLGTDSPGEADEWFELDNLKMGEGYDFNTSYDEETGKLGVSDNDPDLDNFDLEVTIYDESGSNEYTYDDVTPGDDGQALFDVSDDGSVDMDIDQDGDGTPDDQDTDDDGDGVPDDQDTDDDGDGIPDDQEVGGDKGGD